MSTRRLGNYEIVERLGRGGMAEVYRAYHINLDRFVAIKVLHAFLADDPEFKSRFEKEARNIARLKHNNIVQVYDFENDANHENYYMVMELIEGPTLKDLLTELAQRGELMPLKEALRIVREAAGALSYAHSQSMIHRDVKPANLMLDRDSRVVLTDFGIAKIVTGVQFTASGGMVGTPAYMAPEQGLGEAGDERSDLYSIGVIMFQLVTGHLPYEGETPLAVILKHLNEPAPSARTFNPMLPESVDRIIQRLMAKEPDERYQSSAELIADLEKVERGQTIDMTVPQKMTRSLSAAFDEHDTPSYTPVGITGTGRALVVPNVSTPALPAAGSPPNRRIPLWTWVLFAAMLGTIIYLAAVRGDGAPLLAFLSSPTPTATATATETPSDTPTATSTPTASDTPDPTATATPSDTPTATLTPSDTPTATATATVTETPTVTPTPTIDLTATLIAATQFFEFQTATMAVCDFDYAIAEQQPADNAFHPANQPYLRTITLVNTGECAWERNTALFFVQGEDFDAGPYVFIRQRVNVGEEIELAFSGRTPQRGGDYSGTWELRTPGQLLIGDPLTISLKVFEQGSGG